MIVKNAELHDIEQLARLFDDYRVFYEKESDLSGSKDFLIDRIKNNDSTIFIAEDNDTKLAGFVQLYPLFSSTRMKKLWLLNDLFVALDFRGQSISKLLIEKSQNFAKESKSCGLILETAKSNTIGNNLYARTGFTLDKDHNYYYWDV